MFRIAALCLLALALGQAASAQRPRAADAASAYRQKNEAKILREFAEFLRIPNVSSDRENIRRNAQHIARMYEARGVRTELVESPGANPAVFGAIDVPGATRTLLFYAHYDGQPVTPSRWADGAPFEPVLRTGPLESGGTKLPLEQPRYDPEWRLFARSASDDKAPILAMATALDALKAAGLPLKSNLRFFFEGEEEAGSANLRTLLALKKQEWKGALWIMCDGPVSVTRDAKLSFGNRGDAHVEITVYGPRRGLHSGHYGNWAPNPAMQLSRLLASMTDGEGRVLIQGFYDDVAPLTQSEKRAIAEVPAADEAVKRDLLLGSTLGFGGLLRESIFQPSLTVRGLESGGVLERASNEIPPLARASLDLRLVKGNDGARQIEKVVAHVRSQGYYVVDGREPTEAERLQHGKVARVDRDPGYNAARTPLDHPAAQELIGVARAVRSPLQLEVSSGGSLPVIYFEEATGLPTVSVPIVNHDNNQHTHNENLRLANLWEGIELLAALLAM
jgi:acetylornithine deacetylase/succinyl-diaminopimelate desuccinylase-like protein